MRISDWSSDVGSSDLDHRGDRRGEGADHAEAAGHVGRERRRAAGFGQLRDQRRRHGAPDGLAVGVPRPRLGRSEEHTSELQSLMRISYAVFCLKKKQHNTRPTNTQAESKITPN